jgi:hypothetical protein
MNFAPANPLSAGRDLDIGGADPAQRWARRPAIPFQSSSAARRSSQTKDWRAFFGFRTERVGSQYWDASHRSAPVVADSVGLKANENLSQV